jgi:hypothetical protein
VPLYRVGGAPATYGTGVADRAEPDGGEHRFGHEHRLDRGRGDERRITPLGSGHSAGFGGAAIVALLWVMRETVPVMPETNPE